MTKDTDDKQSAGSLEQQMTALGTLVEKLEDPNVSLEESLALYEQGMKLVGEASQTLEAAEQRVAMVTADGELQALDE